jgi:hypothetical protein
MHDALIFSLVARRSAPFASNWVKSIILLVLAGAITVVVTWVASESLNVRLMLRDLQAITGNGLIPPWFAGWLVYAGAVGWFGAAAIAFFGWLLLRKRPGRARIAWLLGGFSILTLIMGVDDLFMLHDGVLWAVFNFGESNLMPIWIALAVIWGLIYLPELLGDPNMPISVGAVVLFAFGIFGDLAPDTVFGIVNEDVAKLAGIMLWSLWGLFVTRRNILREFTMPRSEGAAHPASFG